MFVFMLSDYDILVIIHHEDKKIFMLLDVLLLKIYEVFAAHT